MKRRKLEERFERLEERISHLEARPSPTRCDECGVLFLLRPSMTITTAGFSIGHSQPQEERRVVEGNRVHITYVHTRELCTPCQNALRDQSKAVV